MILEASKPFLGTLAVAMGLASFSCYLWTIFKWNTKPHLFSWVIWGTIQSIAFAGQLTDHAGPGAWITGIGAGLCLLTALLSFKKGEKHITRSDWLFFIAALCAIPIWMITHDPPLSVILVTAIDTSAFAPTFRKAFHKPYEEAASMYFLSGVTFVLSILALNHLSFLSTLYPASLVINNFSLCIMLLLRRRIIAI